MPASAGAAAAVSSRSANAAARERCCCTLARVAYQLIHPSTSLQCAPWPLLIHPRQRPCQPPPSQAALGLGLLGRRLLARRRLARRATARLHRARHALGPQRLRQLLPRAVAARQQQLLDRHAGAAWPVARQHLRPRARVALSVGRLEQAGRQGRRADRPRQGPRCRPARAARCSSTIPARPGPAPASSTAQPSTTAGPLPTCAMAGA
jgi:hypothetical protein